MQNALYELYTDVGRRGGQGRSILVYRPAGPVLLRFPVEMPVVCINHAVGKNTVSH